MARVLGPKHRLCRRVGTQLCDLARCPVVRRNYPPGVHGPKRAPKRTEYGMQLLEKQKAKRVYGILERQFRNYFTEARRQIGDTGHLLHQILERRLDNIVFRLGFLPSRDAARQAITHGHFTVNGKRVTIPSYRIRAGDAIEVRAARRTSPLFRDFPQLAAQRKLPEWLSVEPAAFRGLIIRIPEPTDLTSPPFQVRSIVEYYSR